MDSEVFSVINQFFLIEWAGSLTKQLFLNLDLGF